MLRAAQTAANSAARPRRRARQPGDVFAMTTLERVLAVPAASALCRSPSGRALNVDPGDIAVVTGSRDRRGHLGGGRQSFSLLLPFRSSDQPHWIKEQFGTSTTDKRSRTVTISVAHGALGRVLDVLHTEYRYVFFRADTSAQAELVRANAACLVVDEARANELRAGAPQLSHQVLRNLVATAIGAKSGNSRIEIGVFADTAFRGGFLPLTALRDPIDLWCGNSLLIRCRTARSGWHVAIAFNEVEPVGKRAGDLRPPAAALFSLVALRGKNAAEAIESASEFYRALPELRISEQRTTGVAKITS